MGEVNEGKAPEPRQDTILAMCDAYCRTSGNGGGPQRYAKAMARVLAAMEARGWHCAGVPEGGTDG